MLKSMTAYGRGYFEVEGAYFTVEVQSVNRRHLEIQVVVPEYLGLLESDVRSAVAKKVTRGQLTVKARLSFHGKPLYRVTPNIALAKSLKHAWENISSEIGVEGFSLSFLAQVPEVMSWEMETSNHAELRQSLLQALDLALEQLAHSKDKEGAILTKDIGERIKFLSKTLDQIELMSFEAPAKWRKKLLERLNELLATNEEDERLTKEVALYADKIDITEECVRFKSHLKHLSEVIGKVGACGKPMEFILQELGREINTIGSKCQDAEVARKVIEAKSEIEKIREQVQNVE